MKIIGHRGARGLAPENTLAGIQKALEHGVDAVEFDLRVTKDRVVILLHNSSITDASGQKLRVVEHTYKALLAHKPDLASFEEVLTHTPRSAQLLLEVKRRVDTEPIIKLLEAHLNTDWSEDNFILGSKSQKTLLELHRALPALRTLVIEPWSGLRANWRARRLGTNLVAMNKLWLWRGFITAVANSHLQLYAYTLNDPKKANKWARAGLAGAITDYPDRFKAK